MSAIGSIGAALLVALSAPSLPQSSTPALSLAAIALGQVFVLPPWPSAVDLCLALAAVVTCWPRTAHDWSFTPTTPSLTLSRRWTFLKLLPPAWRPHLHTILQTPGSRKIFWFLMINLAYMGVQMGYGIMTNSLGLISDGMSGMGAALTYSYPHALRLPRPRGRPVGLGRGDLEAGYKVHFWLLARRDAERVCEWCVVGARGELTLQAASSSSSPCSSCSRASSA